MIQFRQGDVLLTRIEDAGDAEQTVRSVTVARGELTGHAHTVRAAGATWAPGRMGGTLELPAGGTLLHQEHGPIVLPAGVYRVDLQREYTTLGTTRAVRD